MLLLKLLGTLTASAMVAIAQPVSPALTPAPPMPGRPAHGAFYEPPSLDPSAVSPAPPSTRAILVNAAQQQGVDPNLLLAVSWWESGWRQDQVSSEGAVGLMQVMPKTAAVVGPTWLHREVDINNPSDNALLGAALLGDLLHKYDRRTALASYYQGEPAIQSGRYAADTWRYADGILGLANQFAGGWAPPGVA